MTAKEHDEADDKAARERLGDEANVPEMSKYAHERRRSALIKGLLAREYSYGFSLSQSAGRRRQDHAS